MAWKDGPLPPGTWNWGGVVTKETAPDAFYFADFCGDHAKVQTVDKDGKWVEERVEAADVVKYDNSLTCPDPRFRSQAGAETGVVLEAWPSGTNGITMRVLLPGRVIARFRTIYVQEGSQVSFNGTTVTTRDQLLLNIGSAARPTVTLHPLDTLAGASVQAEFKS